MGLDIPITAPLDVRWDQWGMNFWSWVWLFLCARRRRQVDTSRARTAPKMAPGKKPAIIAFGGKESQLVEAEGDGTMVNVAPVEPVEVDGEAVVVDLSATQTLSETQE